MKVIILAGGKGTRIEEYTKLIPKPMISVGGKPIIEHIIDHYQKYNFKEFIIAAGYKSNILKNYFSKKKFKNVNVIDTGNDTLTGKRIFKLKNYVNDETFMLTYGDGISNINIKKLLKFHFKKKKTATMTIVHPPARFGEVEYKNGIVRSFEEKPQLQRGWINGGFFVFNKSIFNFLGKKNVMLEREPLQLLVKHNELSAYAHKKFWFCMDNLRDKNVLEHLIKTNKAPWLKN